MSADALKTFLDYGPLGAFIVIFSLVIRYQHKLHQRTIERIEREKTEQLAELRLEIRELRAAFAELSGENHVVIRENTNAIQKNTEVMGENVYLLRDLLNKRLDA